MSAGEQRTLSCVADELAVSDPKLASMLQVFNRLASDEEMPARRRAGGTQPEAGGLRRTRRRARKQRLLRRSVNVVWPVLTWMLLTAALITVAIVLSNIGHGSDGRWDCPQWGRRSTSWPQLPRADVPGSRNRSPSGTYSRRGERRSA
jgi:hypothetical protein